MGFWLSIVAQLREVLFLFLLCPFLAFLHFSIQLVWEDQCFLLNLGCTSYIFHWLNSESVLSVLFLQSVLQPACIQLQAFPFPFLPLVSFTKPPLWCTHIGIINTLSLLFNFLPSFSALWDMKSTFFKDSLIAFIRHHSFQAKKSNLISLCF